MTTASLLAELNPASLLEQIFANEIAGAAERLRRCTEAETRLGDFSETTDKIRRSIEKSRAAAQLALHRAATALRKLQADRRKEDRSYPHPASPEAASAWSVASNCKTENTPPTPIDAAIARSAPCPCNSGEKYKRCCGRTAAGQFTSAA